MPDDHRDTEAQSFYEWENRRNGDKEFSHRGHRGHRDKGKSFFCIEDKKLCVLCELCGKENLSLCASVVMLAAGMSEDSK